MSSSSSIELKDGLGSSDSKDTMALECHIRTVEEVIAHHNTSLEKGLTSEQVREARAHFGSNELTHEEGKPLWALVLEQFDDLLVRILLAAAVVSFLLALIDSSDGLTAYVEPLVILLILVANAFVGVWQESNAEQALEALKSLQPEKANVLRDGEWSEIKAQDLVPGDMVRIRVGDKVPADLRLCLLKTTTLKAEQSQLTGESQSVQKVIDPLDSSCHSCELQSKVNCLFSSTTIANGDGIGCVVATGMDTEIGTIQAAVQQAGQEDSSTPLSRKIDEFGSLLSKVIGVICIIVWVINIRNFSDPSHGGFVRGCIYYFKIAVALAVAAIPEGLPAVITTCLALGTRKMAQKCAIVRRLPSVETLGCTTVICSDKTGTLTTNEMSCVQMYLPATGAQGFKHYKIEGTTYTPVGRVLEADSADCNTGKYTEIPLMKTDRDSGLIWLARVCSLCNEAKLKWDQKKCMRLGEPTEAALAVLVEKLGCPDTKTSNMYFQKLDPNKVQAFGEYWSDEVTKMAILEFTRERKSMSVLVREKGAKQNMLLCKGSPEALVDRCDTLMQPDGKPQKFSPEIKKSVLRMVDDMASDALRVLAMAIRVDCGNLKDYDGPSHREHAQLTDTSKFAEVESNMCFCGIVGIMDPPRPEVAESIAQCRQAGIKVIMITGDNKTTAEAISNRIGILYKLPSAGTCSPSLSTKRSLTGKEFEELSDSQRITFLSAPGGAVFSRTEPKHKQMIVKILREIGEVAAMTGDGVNDAPALKQADIGISMGIAGTEVAKEASDMILADDNFSTIVSAVEEGRSIYNNMKAFIRYLISSNIGEVASIFMTAALGIPEGLAPVQLLWVNLVTDGPPATALGFNPPDVDVMIRPPRRSDDTLISGWVFVRYLIIGLYVGFATVGIFIWWYIYGIDPNDGHTLVEFWQLRHWTKCRNWTGFTANTVYGMDSADPCSYFISGKIKASTLSLTVLVVIEMLNSLNALSEQGSLLQRPPWSNPYLMLAIAGSLAVHCAILYIPWMARVFSVVPLTAHDWYVVFVWSIPVIIIDEFLKLIARMTQAGRLYKHSAIIPGHKEE